MPPNAPTDPTRPASHEQATSSADKPASGEGTRTADQAAPQRGEVKGDLARLQQEAMSKNAKSRVGAQGELDAIERLAQEGKSVEKLSEQNVTGQKEPDLRVDGKLREIKTRVEELDDKWVKKQIEDANRQFRDSKHEDPYGSVDLQLKDQVATDSQLLEKAERQVRGQFKTDRSTSVTEVRLYNDGRMIGEWSRVGDKIIRTFSILAK
jgi:hypothetical protein